MNVLLTISGMLILLGLATIAWSIQAPQLLRPVQVQTIARR